MKKTCALFLAGLLICSFSACSNVSEIIAGELKVALAKIERTGDGSVQVTWVVENPNVVSYLVSKGTHRIMLNGTLIGTIVQDLPLGVPANSQLERTGLLVPAGPAAGAVIDQAVQQGSAAYQVDSTVILLILDDKFEKVRLARSGTVAVVAK